jgi:hypothetical protein
VQSGLSFARSCTATGGRQRHSALLTLCIGLPAYLRLPSSTVLE